jgi:hypothetical protein
MHPPGPTCGPDYPNWRPHMSTNTIVLIILLVLLFGGGGFFWSRRGG